MHDDKQLEVIERVNASWLKTWLPFYCDSQRNTFVESDARIIPDQHGSLVMSPCFTSPNHDRYMVFLMATIRWYPICPKWDSYQPRINVSKKLQKMGLGFTCATQAALAAAAVSHSTVSAPSKLHFPLQGNSQRSHNQADRKIKKSETCCSRNGLLLVSSK